MKTIFERLLPLEWDLRVINPKFGSDSNRKEGDEEIYFRLFLKI